MTQHRNLAACRPTVTARSGHTLVELLISLSVYTVLLGLAGTSTFIVLKTQARDDAGWRDRIEAHTIAMQITSDLRHALSFSKRLNHEVELTVPDRNSDGLAEKIYYAWSGNAGEPLSYRFNEITEVLAPAVDAFNLDYELITNPSLPLDEELALLKYHDDAPEGHFHDHKIEDDKWCAQYIFPAFPDGVTPTVWKIKGLRIMAKTDGDPTGVFEVRITTANLQLEPTDTILDVATIFESDLDSEYKWLDIDFTSINDLSPSQGVCVVVAQISPDGSAAKIPYNHGGKPMTGGTHWLKSDNGGVSWSDPDPSKDMRFYLYGTYDNYNPQTRSFVSAAHLQLQLSGVEPATVHTSTTILNAPEVKSP